MRGWGLLLLFVLGWGQVVLMATVAGTASAATRLGLHVTQEELTIWRARMTDTVNGVNGYSFQSIYQNRLLADANSFRSQPNHNAAGDGFWAGYTAAGCVPRGDQGINPGNGGTPWGRGNGAWLLRAAFTFLLTGDTSYANPIRTLLLSQITQAGTDWTNTSKWCPNTSSSDGLNGSNMLEIIPWIYRLVIAYDYLIAGGYAGFSGTEKTNITTWFRNAAVLWDNAQIFLNSATVGAPYPGIYNTPQNLVCSGCPKGAQGATYFGGPTIDNATGNYIFNQMVTSPSLSMAVGLMTNDTTLINHAVAFVKAYLTVGLYDNGAITDFGRWKDCTPPCVQSMWSHTACAVSGLVAVADMYARAGDTSLYTQSGATQIVNGAGGTVDLRSLLQLWAKMANNTVQFYGTTDGGQLNETTRLTWLATGHPLYNGPSYWDFVSMAANLFYNNSDIHTAMTRNLQGSNTTSSCADGTMSGCFTGTWATWADLPYMFGNMEGQVNPYALTAGPVARYLFEGNANDNIGTHHGVLQGGATATAPGQTGLGLTLDGVNDYVSITSATDLNMTGDTTVAFWAKLTAAGNGDVILAKEGVTPDFNEPYHVEIANSGTPHYAWYHNSNNDFSTYKEFTAYTIPLNIWHRVVVTRTQATKALSLYVNGQFQQTLTGWTNDAGSTAQPLFLGANGTLDSTRFLAGMLDDVLLEPRVWTLGEIQADGQTLAPLLLRVVR